MSSLRDAITVAGYSLGDLTVLKAENDPFRQDTRAGHRDGEWLARQAGALGLLNRTVHLRGLHYALLGRVKPNGEPYQNTDKEWTWLSGDVAKAARWLGYLPFENIVDARNASPVVRLTEAMPEPQPIIAVGTYIDLPTVDAVMPEVHISEFHVRQPYRVVIFGEKTSLTEVLSPVADRYDCDLYLPSGEISDTMMHTMARTAAADGRPMVVLTFSDCDPAGWQMPISIARKLQALQVGFFPDIEFQVHRVALSPDQVRDLELPSTPLKAGESRASAWQTTMGVGQTEIDALGTLRPTVLRAMAAEAVESFHDDTLWSRTRTARSSWLTEARERLETHIGAEELARIRADAEARLDRIAEQVRDLRAAMQIDIGDAANELPEVVLPEPEEVPGLPGALIESGWSFEEQTEALKRSKAYGDDPGVTK